MKLYKIVKMRINKVPIYIIILIKHNSDGNYAIMLNVILNILIKINVVIFG